MGLFGKQSGGARRDFDEEAFMRRATEEALAEAAARDGGGEKISEREVEAEKTPPSSPSPSSSPSNVSPSISPPISPDAFLEPIDAHARRRKKTSLSESLAAVRSGLGGGVEELEFYLMAKKEAEEKGPDEARTAYCMECGAQMGLMDLKCGACGFDFSAGAAKTISAPKTSSGLGRYAILCALIVVAAGVYMAESWIGWAIFLTLIPAFPLAEFLVKSSGRTLNTVAVALGVWPALMGAGAILFFVGVIQIPEGMERRIVQKNDERTLRAFFRLNELPASFCIEKVYWPPSAPADPERRAFYTISVATDDFDTLLSKIASMSELLESIDPALLGADPSAGGWTGYRVDPIVVNSVWANDDPIKRHSGYVAWNAKTIDDDPVLQVAIFPETP